LVFLLYQCANRFRAFGVMASSAENADQRWARYFLKVPRYWYSLLWSKSTAVLFKKCKKNHVFGENECWQWHYNIFRKV